MIRSLFTKLVRLGRARFAATLALVLVVGLATTARAHTGSAGLLHRNHSNTVSAVTGLVGSVPGSVLGITNNNTAATNGSATAITAANNNATSPTIRAGNSAGGTALDLAVTCKTTSACFKPPPMSVNSDTKVANLNADKLDGRDSTDFLGVNETAFNSTFFNGMSSSEFIQGRGKTIHVARVVPTGQSPGIFYFSPEFYFSRSQCNSSGGGTLYFGNNSPAPLRLFTEYVNDSMYSNQLAENEDQSFSIASTEHIVFGVHGDGFVATIDFFSADTAQGCDFYLQGVLTESP